MSAKLTDTQREALVTRLNSIAGQARGIQQHLLADSRDCQEIVEQLAALRAESHAATIQVLPSFALRCLQASTDQPEQVLTTPVGVVSTLVRQSSALPVAGKGADHMFENAPTTDEVGVASQPTSKGEQKAERLSIVLFSGTVDKLMAASILATGAAAMGMEVDLFLTTWGLMAFRKGDWQTNTRVSADFADYASVMQEQMQAKHVPSWMENLQGASEIGTVHIVACSMTMELYDLTLSDLEPIVDEVTGVATFIERARASQTTLFI